MVQSVGIFAKVSAVAALLAGTTLPAQAAAPAPASARGVSPAQCGPDDRREPGVQGEVPAGATANYNCGVRLVAQLPRVGGVQGVGTCAYVRSRGGQIFVVDVRDPAKPVEVGSVPVKSGSESFRVVVNGDRALMVSGSSVYDVRDCLKPVLLGEIQWPPLSMAGIPSRTLPHDIRLNHAATRVYASFGLWEADLTNLKDPSSWKVTDHRCELAAQQPGPWQEIHRQTLKVGRSLCEDSGKPSPQGANNVVAASPLQGAVLWPSLSHSPDFNADDTRIYVGDQAGGTSGLMSGGQAKVRIIDLTQKPLKIIGEIDGPGHGLDWFRHNGRDYILHSNEGGVKGILGQGLGSDTCKPYPRPSALGWGYDVFISDVTDAKRTKSVGMLRIAINDPEFCQVRKASGKDPWLAYHLIDNPLNPKFVMANFGDGGFRIFDIRNPAKASEVAYFNDGNPVHSGVGYYDAARGLIYAPSGKGLAILEIEPQVKARLGL